MAPIPSGCPQAKVPSSLTKWRRRVYKNIFIQTLGHTLYDRLPNSLQTPWLGPPLESLSMRHSALRKSVSGAPAMLSLTRHPAVTSHTAACRRIVRCRQRQCHCQCYAQRAPTLLLTFTLSPSVPPSPGALAVDCSRTRPRSESKPCRKTPNSPHHPASQSRLAAHSNQTSFPRYPLLEIRTPSTTPPPCPAPCLERQTQRGSSVSE